jgi:hypothetical protein
MAIHDKYFTGSTVSRFLPPGEHSWDEAVYQSGKPVLDAELNLSQDLGKELRKLVQDRETPSGWLRGPTPVDPLEGFVFPTSTDPDFVADTFWMKKRTALVANMPLTVEYTNTTEKGKNLIQLSTAPVNGGASPDVKRTDFVFLEVFRALVSPSPHASGTLLVLTSPTTGDFNIAGVALTAAGGPRGVGVGANNYDNTLGSAAAIAGDIRDALNDTSNGFAVSVTAVLDISVAEQVNIRATDAFAGAAGNAFSLTTTIPAEFTLSGVGFLSGGVDTPNKPTQSTIYRNGNVDAPAGVNLADEIADPTIGTESTKRVQMQYRVRATGQAENVNFKTENGFSNPKVEAQGTNAVPVDGYRFIPADGTTVLAYVDITGALGVGDTVVVNGITLTAINGGVPAADEFDMSSGVPATMATSLTAAITASVAATAAASSADGTVTIIPPTAGGDITLSTTAPANLTVAVNSAVSYDTVDNGLWIAGNGTLAASNDLGTVDGYVYAISMSFVFRRNDASGTGGFDPEANTNGALAYNHGGYANPHGIGTIPAATSDRPDRNFYDAIVAGDLLDLRRQVSPGGVDLKAELESQMTALLDGNFQTWAVDTQGLMELGGGSGDVSPVYLVCNYVGGDGTSTRGNGIGVWDHIRRRFADQPVVEKRVFPIIPTATAVNNPGLFMTTPAAGWEVGDQINIDLDSLDAAGLGDWSPTGSPDYVSNLWPTGTTITNVLRVVHDDGHYATPISQQAALDQITGLGTAHVIITLGANNSSANGGVDGAASYPLVPNAALGTSARRIFVELEITYPAGSAATPALRPAMATPDETLVADPAVTAYHGSALIDDPGTLAGSDWDNMVDPAYREGKREIGFEYVSNEIGSGEYSNTPITTQVVSGTDITMVLSRRMWGQKGASTITVTEQGSGVPTPRAVNVVDTTWGSSERTLVLTGNLSAQQSLCDVNYFAQDPIPNLGAIGARLQISAYYRTNAPQTVGVQAGAPAGIPLPDPFLVEPVVMSRFLWTGTTSVGSVDLPFPYNNPSDQIAVNADLTTGASPPFPGEWALMSLAKISVGDFDAETGLLNLHQMVPVDPNSDLQFSSLDMDNEFRAAYKVADVNSYRPTAMAQPLSGVATHKVWMPFLAQSSVDNVYFRKGEVLLVIVSRYALLDGDNVVRFVDGGTESCAAIYRTRGLLLLASE